MDWEPWFDRGVIRAIDRGGRQPSLDRVKSGWDCVISARAAYLRSDWELTDAQLRGAFTVGIDALLLREELEPTREYDLELIQRISREMFEEKMVDRIFERARILRSMLPLEPILPESQLRLIRRSIAASSEFVALAEGYCFN